MAIRLDFFGAAQNVTGSCYLLDTGAARVAVDCGIYQERALTQRNWGPFPLPPNAIDAVLLTHAHLDHCGLLPRLVQQGFGGPVYCTAATADIAAIVLRDSARIQMEDVETKRRRHARQGRKAPHPYEPLYTPDDAERAIGRFAPVAYDTRLDVAPGLAATFGEAGHILGSAWVCVEAGGNGAARRIVFSGDVGRWNSPIIRDPVPPREADYVLVESTYGNKVHKPADTIPERLATAVSGTCARGGKILIPSFSVERTQELLYHLGLLREAGRIPAVRVYVDSPMAISVTEVFRRHPELFDDETRELLRSGRHPCDFPGVTMCRTVEESKAINALEGPAIVIAGSGMCTGGRIKHHIAHHVGNPASLLLFVGYQASGTLGRLLLEGARTVRLFGEDHDVRIRVERINGFSAHADREELLRWLGGLAAAPRRVFVTHGEPPAADSFAAAVRSRTGWAAAVARYCEGVTLE